MGDLPIVVIAVADTRIFRTFSRLVSDRELTFHLAEGLLIDEETGTTWDPFTGAAHVGPLAGERLAPASHTLSFDWAWQIFHPDSR
jgi:hypothetical protein